MNIICQKHILLTGAGFTKNFGAPLAREVWNIIFNNPVLEKAPDVRRILLQDFDFESVYNRVTRDPMPLSTNTVGFPPWEDQQQALRQAVNQAYEYIDDKVRSFSFRDGTPYPVNIYKVQEFISRFAGTRESPGFFFTLNQDLFIERQYYNGQPPTLPGIQHRSSWFTTNTAQSLLAERSIISDSEIKITSGSSPFYYVKLHGSSNWYAADQQTMVLGREKQRQIATQPLLVSYLAIFRSVLTSGNRRLLCLGYGFSDEHINAVISEGVQAGLRLYVLSPEPIELLAERIKQDRTGENILSGLAGYFQYDLKTLFPVDPSTTGEWSALQTQFFQ